MLVKSSLDFLRITKVISIDWCASQCSTKNETKAKMETSETKLLQSYWPRNSRGGES